MAGRQLPSLVEQFRRAIRAHCGDWTDAQLLDRYLTQHDDLAFEALVWRHGGSVMGVCQRVLHDAHAAEDAFQATFLVFVRKARAIGKRQSVGSWLYKVAYRVALRAKARISAQPAQSSAVEQLAGATAEPPNAWQELRPVLDEEINRLPAKYRTPFVLHYLEAKDCGAVAQEIGFSKATVSNRLAKARDLLQKRLTRRGVGLATGLLGSWLAESAFASVTGNLVSQTVTTARGFAAGSLADTTKGTAVTLAEGVLNTMLRTKQKIAAALLVAVLGLGGGTGLVLQQVVAARPAADTELAADPSGDEAPSQDGAVPLKKKWVNLDREGEPLPDGAVARLGTLQIEPGLAVRALAFTDGGKTVFSYDDVAPRRWDAWTGARQEEPRHDGWRCDKFTRCICSADGKFVALSQIGGTARLLDVTSGKVINLTHINEEYVRFMAFSPDGRWFASVGGPLGAHDEKTKAVPSHVRVWEVATGREVQDIAGGGPVAFTPDSKALAIGRLRAEDYHGTLRYEPLWTELNSDDQNIDLWDLATGKKIRALVQKVTVRGFTHGLVFSPDGRTLVYQGVKCTVRENEEELCLWDMATGKERCQFRESLKRDLTCFAFSPDGKTLATAGGDKRVRLWEVATGKERRSFKGHIGAVTALAFSPDGRRLASGSTDTTILVWDVTGHLLVQRPKLSATELEQLWGDLAGATDKAHQAIGSLAAAPKQTVAHLEARLRPAAALDAQRRQQLLADLGSKEFQTRRQAEQELEKRYLQAVAALSALLAEKPSLDVQQRVERLLQKLEDALTDADLLRCLRSIEILEHIGTNDAKRTLEKLAGGAADARLTQEARASLERLAQRAP